MFIAFFTIVGFVLFLTQTHKINNTFEFLKPNRTQIQFQQQYPVIFSTIKNIIKTILPIFIYLQFPMFCQITPPSSGSMTPTYRVWDMIYSSNTIYGINPENISNPYVRNYVRQFWQKPILAIREPQIGDNVVFRIDNSDIPFSKRIIAQAGDEVIVRGFIFTINGKVCPIRFIEETIAEENNHQIHIKIYEITLPNKTTHKFAIDKNIDIDQIDETLYFKVPKDHYLLMGDFRTNSDDARHLLGYVHRNRIFIKLQWIIMRNPNIRFLNPVDIIKNSQFAILE